MTAKGFRFSLAGATGLLLKRVALPAWRSRRWISLTVGKRESNQPSPAARPWGSPPTRDEPPFFSHHTRQLFAGAMGFPALRDGRDGQAGAAARERSQARTSPALCPSGLLRQTSQYA